MASILGKGFDKELEFYPVKGQGFVGGQLSAGDCEAITDHRFGLSRDRGCAGRTGQVKTPCSKNIVIVARSFHVFFLASKFDAHYRE